MLLVGSGKGCMPGGTSVCARKLVAMVGRLDNGSRQREGGKRVRVH